MDINNLNNKRKISNFENNKRNIELDLLNSDSFKTFYLDLKRYKEQGLDDQDDVIEYMIEPTVNTKDGDLEISRKIEHIHKENIIIFKLDPAMQYDVKRYDISFKKVIVPFDTFFVESPIMLKHDDEIYIVGSFLVQVWKHKIDGKDCESLKIYFCWSKCLEDGWSFCSSKIINFRGGHDKKSHMPKELYPKSYTNKIGDFEETLPILGEILEVIRERLWVLFNLISNGHYRTYKKYTPNGYIHKEIIHSREVKRHKRHFWKDTGYFNIPKMSEKELKEKGYGIDEFVIKDNEVKKNIPYLIIDPFVILKNKKDNKDKKKREYLKTRTWRCEEKVYSILKELFPNNYIRRHDRKTLNGLELDFNLPELRLGVEYDGEQHFDRKLCEEVFKSDFDALQKRDREKNKRCRKKNINLIRIKYDEPLTKRHIIKKLKNNNIIT